MYLGVVYPFLINSLSMFTTSYTRRRTMLTRFQMMYLRLQKSIQWEQQELDISGLEQGKIFDVFHLNILQNYELFLLIIIWFIYFRYLMWLEAYLSNGKVMKSEVDVIRTKVPNEPQSPRMIFWYFISLYWLNQDFLFLSQWFLCLVMYFIIIC